MSGETIYCDSPKKRYFILSEVALLRSLVVLVGNLTHSAQILWYCSSLDSGLRLSVVVNYRSLVNWIGNPPCGIRWHDFRSHLLVLEVRLVCVKVKVYTDNNFWASVRRANSIDGQEMAIQLPAKIRFSSINRRH